MVTLKDIAKKAGVSAMTVSRALNGKMKDISPQTAEKIRKIAEEMGYIPYSSARALASHSSKLVAVLLLDKTESPNPLMDSYNSYFCGELAREIQKNGYDLMLHIIQDYSEINYCLKSWQVAGAVFIGAFDENIRQIQEDNPIPLIFTDSYSTVRRITNVGIDDFRGGELAAEYLLSKGHSTNVGIDDFRGGELAAEYLLSKGHRNLAFIGPKALGNGVVMHRLQGFTQALEKAGITLPKNRILIFSKKNLDSMLRELKTGPDPVTGIFTNADSMAYEIFAAARRQGYEIPGDFSVVGFDDNPMSPLAMPPLTTIRQNVSLKAEITCQLLMKKLKDPKAVPGENILLDVELVERESVSSLS